VENGAEVGLGNLVQSRGKGVRKPEARSAISNGRDILPNVDGRSTIGRRFHDICANLVSDQGGWDHISEARLQLIRRFSAAAVLAEQLEAKLARGEEVDIQEHALLTSMALRVGARYCAGHDAVAFRIPRGPSC
jgi:hypothetical protein